MKQHFENIVGQETAIARLLVGANAPEGTSLPQPLFFGEAGLGKTEVARATARALAEKLECDVTWFNSPEEFRDADGDGIKTLLAWLEAKRGVLVIDECHKFNLAPTRNMQKVTGFFLKCLDEQNAGKIILFDNVYDKSDGTFHERIFSYDKSQKVIIMMTNHDDQMDSALISRMDVVRLETYTSEELQLITVKMLNDNSLTVDDEKVIKLLAMASRGTARPLDNIIRHLARFGEPVITRETAIQAMIQMGMFPLGLTMAERQLLELAKNPVPKPVAKASITGLEKTLGNSVAFLMSQSFLTLEGPNLKTTDKGKRCLSNMVKLGFPAVKMA
jgi:Holliday junction resolvasome RuvABC ATP-dependent DNA helicase subunit